MQRKKGDIIAIIVFIVMILVIGMAFLLFTYIFHQTADVLNGTALANSTQGARAVQAMDAYGTDSLQKIFLFLFVAFIITMMISSILVQTHPVFLILYIIMIPINMFIAIFASNSYQALNTGVLASTYASQTITSTIMNNLVLITLGATALSLIILFARAVLIGGRGGTL